MVRPCACFEAAACLCVEAYASICWYDINSLSLCSSLRAAALQSVTLHTTLGDIKIEVFCDTAPHTAEVLYCAALALL